MSPISRRMAAKFAIGVRVVATDGPIGPGHRTQRLGTLQGTVVRFVAANNSQGGHVVIEWDSGVTGRKAPGSLAVVTETQDAP